MLKKIILITAWCCAGIVAPAGTPHAFGADPAPGQSAPAGDAPAAPQTKPAPDPRAAYRTAQRLYQQQLKQCEKLVQKGAYVPAIEMLKNTVFLMPGDERAAALKTKAEELLFAAQREAFRRELDGMVASGDRAGAFRAALGRFHDAGQEAVRDDAWRLAQKLYDEVPDSLVPALEEIRQEYAVKLDFETANAAINDDFPRAERCLAKLRLLDPEGPAVPDRVRLIDERRESCINDTVARINDAIEHFRDEEAYLLVQQMLELEPGDAEALAAKRRLEDTLLAAHAPASRDRARCDAFYYAAACSLAGGDVPAANERLAALFSLNPVHEWGANLRRYLREKGRIPPLTQSSPR